MEGVGDVGGEDAIAPYLGLVLVPRFERQQAGVPAWEEDFARVGETHAAWFRRLPEPDAGRPAQPRGAITAVDAFGDAQRVDMPGPPIAANPDLTAIAGDGYVSFNFPDFNDDQWHHMIFRRSGNVFSVYVDGEWQASKTKAAGENTMRLEIGGNEYYSADFNGYLSDAAIWAEALSLERIRDLASGGDVILGVKGTVITVR